MATSNTDGSQQCRAAFSLNDNGWYNCVYRCRWREHKEDVPHEASVMQMNGACKGMQNLKYRVVLKEAVRWTSTDVALHLPLKLLPDSADGTPHGTLYASTTERLCATTTYVTATFAMALLLAPSPKTLDEVVAFVLPYLSLRDVAAVTATCHAVASAAAAAHTAPWNVKVQKKELPGHPAFWSTYGRRLVHLWMQDVSVASGHRLTSSLGTCVQLRKLCLENCAWETWQRSDLTAALGCLAQLQHLKLGFRDWSDVFHPQECLLACLHALPTLHRLRKLTLFVWHLNGECIAALLAYLRNAGGASERLECFKCNTEVVTSEVWGADVLDALATHSALRKLSLVRPYSQGSPLCAAHCRALARNPGLTSLTLTKCGVRCEALDALRPSGMCTWKRLKLNGNALGWGPGARFVETMDALLAVTPALEVLGLANNCLRADNVEGLAASIARHKLARLRILNVGGNSMIGNRGVTALADALPPSLQELYLHGVECGDEAAKAIGAALGRWQQLWSLGLNCNAISNEGACCIADGVFRHPSLRDIGISFTLMSGSGCVALADALSTCPHLRLVFLYTSGDKAADRVTPYAKGRLQQLLANQALLILDSNLSRYIKHA